MIRQETVVITGIGLEVPADVELGPILGALRSASPRNGLSVEERPGRKGLRYKDEATKHALVAGRLALEDAGLPTVPSEQLRPESFGVVASSNLGNVPTVIKALGEIRAKGVDGASPMDLPNASSNNVSATLAIWFGLRALNLMVCNGSTGGTDAIRLAVAAIRAGRADRMLVVGVEVPDEIARRLVAASTGDASRGGEGRGVAKIAAAIVLESAASAQRRGRNAYARVGPEITSVRETLCHSLEMLLATDDSEVDLWMISERGLAGTGTSAAKTAGRLGSLSDARCEDPAETIGETYGAHGVVQAVAASAWLRTHPHCHRILATSGGALGGRAMASILYRSPGGRDVLPGERRAWALARRGDIAHWSVESRSCFGHTLTLRRPAGEEGGMTHPSVLFIHGLGMGAAVWFRLQGALKDDFHTSFLTMPWDGNQGVSWGRAARPEEWIEAGLAMLPSPPDVIIAHSFGANALMEHLAAPSQAARPRAVVLVSPFFKSRQASVEWGVFSHHVNRFLDLLREGLRINDGHTGLAPDIEAGIAAKVRERVGVYGWYEFLRLLLRTPFLDLRAITSPVLVLGGAKDIASDWQDCERLAAALPGARAALSQASGHFCMAQDAAWFIGSIKDFTAHAFIHSDILTS